LFLVRLQSPAYLLFTQIANEGLHLIEQSKGQGNDRKEEKERKENRKQQYIIGSSLVGASSLVLLVPVTTRLALEPV